MKTTELNYPFPETLIAQRPLRRRTASRLCVLSRQDGKIRHQKFSDIVHYFNRGDLIIFNDTKVIPARLYGRKATGARVEIFLLKKISLGVYEALLKPRRRLPIGTEIIIRKGFTATVLRHEKTSSQVRFHAQGCLREKIHKFGQLPLPPYIKRHLTPNDARRYQTVFAKREGASAAPTAGLHFTGEMLTRLRNKGVRVEAVTLHVGYGTFQKISTETVEDHIMHTESFSISQRTATRINQTRSSGGRIFAVGTTSARVLESTAKENGLVQKKSGETNLYIYPPYRFKIVDGLITNFHQPRTSLLCLVSALAGKDLTLKAYREAVEREYRLFSYGDAMLIL